MIIRFTVIGAVMCLAAVSLAAAVPQGPASTDPVVAKALAIHERALTLDTHVDILGPNYATPAVDPGAPTSPLKCDLTKMEKGGVDGAFLAVYVGQGTLDVAGYTRAWERAMGQFQALQRLTQQMYPNRSTFVTSADAVEPAARTGKRVIMTGVENGYPIGTDLANVKKFYDLGARYITLTHSGNNQLGDSSSAREPLHNGLSPFGKEVVAEMNRLGMMVDVSHIAEKSFWDILAITKAPIIASHSGSRAICDHDRNLTDEQLKALAKNGGVIQTVALGSYLRKEDPARREAMMKLREELGLPSFGGRGAGPGGPPAGAQAGGARPNPATMTPEQRADYDAKMAQFRERMKDVDAKYPGATLKDFVDHLDHAVKVAGIDHVGIGTDFDGGGGIPGFNDDTEAPNVTIELVRRGYTEEQITKIWGGNLLRVWREVEKVAAQMQKGQ
jgi:membrane dipeptidase